MSTQHIAPAEASGSTCLVGLVKIIFYDHDFQNSARPQDGEVYHGGWRASVPGHAMGIALVPGNVDVQPDTDLSRETFHGWVKAGDLPKVERALARYPPDQGILKLKVTHVSRGFHYGHGSTEASGVHGEAYCWVDAKEVA